LQKVRDGLALTPFSLSLSEPNDFEQEDATSISLGAVPLCPTRSLELAQVEGLAFQPYCAGRDAAGFLPNGSGDSRFSRARSNRVFLTYSRSPLQRASVNDELMV
jgi:hypothetical protein